MNFDVLIVGGGIAGLSAAIRLKQQAAQRGQDVSVCLIEKSAAIGGHILSGAIIDTRALSVLFPDLCALPLMAPVAEERLLILGEKTHYTIPQFLVPRMLQHQGGYVASLSTLCIWLAEHAESLGVEIFAGFAGVEALYNVDGAVCGVATGAMGVRKDGSHHANYQPGIEIYAAYTLFAEGCRGQLAAQLEAKFALRAGKEAQTYSLGLKEVWEVRPGQHQLGNVLHTLAWPLDSSRNGNGGGTDGGGFLYHLSDSQVAVGLVVGLGYRNPYFSPFAEFQRMKTHPVYQCVLAGAKRLAYGARSLVTGGVQALPKLVFAGGALIGDDAGFLNAARLKGIHSAGQSAILAADACVDALGRGRRGDELSAYSETVQQNWLYDELYRARNVKPALKHGLLRGGLLIGLEQSLLRGKAPWTLRHQKADHLSLDRAQQYRPIDYPAPDGVLTFDRLTSLYLANIRYNEDQPCHLVLKDAQLPITHNLANYGAPEQYYCPAAVYEIVTETGEPRLQINAANCLHCKACDIKDPCQNIVWQAPEGGDGPNYAGM